MVQVDNPLFGATLLAAVGQAGDAVTRILADAARRQDDYLALAAAIPEWCELRIYQLSIVLLTRFFLVAAKLLATPPPYLPTEGNSVIIWREQQATKRKIGAWHYGPALTPPATVRSAAGGSPSLGRAHVR